MSTSSTEERRCAYECTRHAAELEDGESARITLNETFGKGLLDSGCSKTVAGKVWMEEFIKTLSRGDMNDVTNKSSKS